MIALRYKGRMYHIEYNPLENYDFSMDRAWYIAKKHPEKKEEFVALQDESYKWCNEKYLGMKYKANTTDEKIN